MWNNQTRLSTSHPLPARQTGCKNGIWEALAFFSDSKTWLETIPIFYKATAPHACMHELEQSSTDGPMLSPITALHSVANLLSLSHSCMLGKAEDEQSQKNFRCAEVSSLALNDWKVTCGIQLIEALFLFGRSEWFLASCACTHRKCSLYQVRSQPDTPPQKPPQLIFHCQEP